MMFLSRDGDAARVLRIMPHDARKWLSYLPEKVKPRTADVGYVCLSTIVICSYAEAMIATDRVLGEETANPTFEKIAEHLAWAKPPEYYSSWVIVETADID
jgi:hypothetical protein